MNNPKLIYYGQQYNPVKKFVNRLFLKDYSNYAENLLVKSEINFVISNSTTHFKLLTFQTFCMPDLTKCFVKLIG
jgi:hypothetical protein